MLAKAKKNEQDFRDKVEDDIKGYEANRINPQLVNKDIQLQDRLQKEKDDISEAEKRVGKELTQQALDRERRDRLRIEQDQKMELEEARNNQIAQVSEGEERLGQLEEERQKVEQERKDAVAAIEHLDNLLKGDVKTVQQKDSERKFLEMEAGNLKAEIDELKEEIHEKKSEIKEIQHTISTLEAKCAELESKIARLQREIEEVQDWLQDTDQKIEATNMDISNENAKIPDLQKQIQDKRTELANCQDRTEKDGKDTVTISREGERSVIRSQIEALEKEVSQIQQRLSELKQQLKGYEDRKFSLKREQGKLSSEKSETESMKSQVATKIQNEKGRLNVEKAALAVLNKQHQEKKSALIVNRKKVEGLSMEQTELAKMIESLKKDLEKANNRHQEVSNQVKELNGLIGEKRIKLNEMNAKVNNQITKARQSHQEMNQKEWDWQKLQDKRNRFEENTISATRFHTTLEGYQNLQKNLINTGKETLELADKVIMGNDLKQQQYSSMKNVITSPFVKNIVTHLGQPSVLNNPNSQTNPVSQARR